MTELYIFVKKYFSSFISVFKRRLSCFIFSYFCVAFCLSLVRSILFSFLSFSALLTMPLSEIFYSRPDAVVFVFYHSKGAWIRHMTLLAVFFFLHAYASLPVSLFHFVDVYYCACLLVCLFVYMPRSLEKSMCALGVHLR